MTATFLKAIGMGDLAKVTSILNEFGKDLSLETRDKSGKTLLMVAAQSGFDEICRLLILHGASPHG